MSSFLTVKLLLYVLPCFMMLVHSISQVIYHHLIPWSLQIDGYTHKPQARKENFNNVLMLPCIVHVHIISTQCMQECLTSSLFAFLCYFFFHSFATNIWYDHNCWLVATKKIMLINIQPVKMN